MNSISKKSVIDNRTLGWLFRFWGLAALFYWLDHATWFKAVIVAPYAQLSTLATAKILFLLGLECQVNGSALTLSNQTFVIADSCTGSFVFLLLAAVIIAFPASFKEKLLGLAAGFATVIFLNLLRTLMIIILATKFSGSFWSLHIIVGQALMIAGTLGVFIWWAKGVGSGMPLLSPDRRRMLQMIGLYVIGFIVSYILYSLFIKCSLGNRLQSLIISHAAMVLGLFTDTIQQGDVISTGRNSVKIIHACLSSPVLVLFFAAFFILPISWPKRFLLYIICFFPLYYAYNLARIVAVVWFLPTGQNAAFSRNFFSQLVAVSAALIFSIYYWIGIRKAATFRRQLTAAVAAIVLSSGIALLTGWLWQECTVILFVNKGKEFYDPGRTVSLMPIFHILPWLFLVLTTPVWSFRQRISRGLIGYAGLNLFYALVIAILFFSGFTPHPRLIKAVNLLLPFVVYYFLAISPELPSTGPTLRKR